MMRRAISATKAVADIRSGMDDSALMDKYGISAQGLQGLFNKLMAAGLITERDIHERGGLVQGSVALDMSEVGFRPPETESEVVLKSEVEQAAQITKPIISAAQAIRDIKNGMEDIALMKKYDITAKGLQSLFRKLIAAGLLSSNDIHSPISTKPGAKGKIRWKFSTGTSFSSRPVGNFDTIYFGADNGNLYAVDLHSGAQKWEQKLEGGTVLHHIVEDEKVFAVTEFGYLHALDTSTGEGIWKFKPEIGVYDAPVVKGRIVYVGSLDGTLYAVDASTGREVWSFKVIGTAVSSPTIYQDVICFGSDSGNLYCVVPE
jgi:hypothetical protein